MRTASAENITSSGLSAPVVCTVSDNNITYHTHTHTRCGKDDTEKKTAVESQKRARGESQNKKGCKTTEPNSYKKKRDIEDKKTNLDGKNKALCVLRNTHEVFLELLGFVDALAAESTVPRLLDLDLQCLLVVSVHSCWTATDPVTATSPVKKARPLFQQEGKKRRWGVKPVSL